MDSEYIRALRAMTPEEKLLAAACLNDFARHLMATLLRAFHPHWTEEQIQCGVREWLEQATS